MIDARKKYRKMTGETPEVRSNKRKPREDRQNHRYNNIDPLTDNDKNAIWYSMILDGIGWYSMVLDGIAWYCMVFDYIEWS